MKLTFRLNFNEVETQGGFTFGEYPKIRARTVIFSVAVKLYFMKDKRLELLQNLGQGNIEYILNYLRDKNMTKYLDILLQDKEECGDYGAADIMFVIDGSGQMGLNNFQKAIQFLRSLVFEMQV